MTTPIIHRQLKDIVIEYGIAIIVMIVVITFSFGTGLAAAGIVGSACLVVTVLAAITQIGNSVSRNRASITTKRGHLA